MFSSKQIIISFWMFLVFSCLTFSASANESANTSGDTPANKDNTLAQVGNSGTLQLATPKKLDLKKALKAKEDDEEAKTSSAKKKVKASKKSKTSDAKSAASKTPPKSLTTSSAKKAQANTPVKAPAAPAKSSGVRGNTPSLVKPNSPDKPPTPTMSDAPQMGNQEGDRRLYKALEKGQPFHIDYYEADLIEFVKQMSEKFKINFILSDKIKGGKITIISPNPVTREEAWQAFLSALHSKELTLVKVGKFWKIIALRDAQSAPLKTYLQGGTTDPTEEVITYLLKLKYLAIKDIERVLKDLKTKSGEIISFEPTNTMIITDSAINIRRMIKIVNELDLPSGRDAIHVIDIYYASADDIADKLQQIFGDKGRKSSSSSKKRKKGRKSKSKSSSTSSDSAQSVSITNVIADDRTNQLIIVAQRDAMPRILDMINRLDVAVPGDGQVHVYYLENANAEELASTLTGIAGKGSKRKKSKKSKRSSSSSGNLFEGDVRITADKSTNSLVIVASTKDFNSLKRVIAKLDIRRRQVFVEAVIMEVTLKKDNSHGVALAGGYAMEIAGETVPIYSATTLGTMSSILMDPTTLSGLAVGLQGPEIAGTEGMLGNGISIPTFGVLLQMLQTDSDANVLSTPHILTMDNEEAEIIVGSNVPFITGQSRDSNNNPVLSIQRQDVALTLKIKPQINESDYVRLQVQQEITELVSISETLGPTTTKRAAKTTVVVKDNQTIVIGGLIRDMQTNDSEKVPLLGDIPILGRLFRRDKKHSEKTNLLIFLTPHIIKSEDDFKRIFKRKMDERKEFLQRFYGNENEYEFQTDYTQKTGIIEAIRETYMQQEAKMQEKQQEEQEIIISPESGHSAFEIGFTDKKKPSSGSGKTFESETKIVPLGEHMRQKMFKHQPSGD